MDEVSDFLFLVWFVKKSLIFLGPQCPESGHWGTPKNGGFFDKPDSRPPNVE